MKTTKPHRLPLFLLLGMVFLHGGCVAPEKTERKLPLRSGNEYLDLFVGDGDSLLTRPEHLGIVSNRSSVGVLHHYVGVLSGFWAQPYVSTNFYLEPRLWGERIKTDHYLWWPFRVKQTGTIKGVDVTSTVTLINDSRSGVLTLEFHNKSDRIHSIPLQLVVNDPFTYAVSLDYHLRWGFDAPVSKTWVKDTMDDRGLIRRQGAYALTISGFGGELQWEPPTRRFHRELELTPGKTATVQLLFTIGKMDEAIAERNRLLVDPSTAVEASERKYQAEVQHIYDRLPRFYSDNKALEQLYNRSLSIFVVNKMEVPGFVLNPYYATGAIKGGCTCNYLYNFGQVREIMSLLDPEAMKEHIIRFLITDCVEMYYSFYPMTGEPFGAWYMVNHEKITSLVYHYIKSTGDTDLLRLEIKGGKTVLDLMVECADFGNPLTEPVKLIDYAAYGWENSHLELRRTYLGHEYSHVMPDLNGRRYYTYRKVSELCELMDCPRPYLKERAETLKHLLKNELWNGQIKWFHFINKDRQKEVRWTMQMYKMFEGPDSMDEEVKEGLLSHLNRDEFLSDYGLHSLSKIDPAYDQVDIDNGGGGTCVSFPALIAEFLYKDGRSEMADRLMERLLWFGSRMPYFSDSHTANELDYRQDTPLLSNIEQGAHAQTILFGLFGLDVRFDGTIVVNPRPTSMCRKRELRGVKIRGRVFDLLVEGDRYTLTLDGETYRRQIGTPVIIQPQSLNKRKR